MKSIINPFYCSIRYKLIIINAIVIASISLFIFYIFPAQQQKNAMDSVRQKAESISHILAYNLQSALYFEDKAAANEIVQSALQNDDLAYLIVENASGTIFTVYEKNVAQQLEYKELELQNDVVYKTAIPIVNDQLKIGVLYLGLSLGDIKLEVEKSRNKIALISISIFMFGFIIIFFSSEIITSSLRKMLVVTKSVGAGDFSNRVEVNSSDEIGILANSFNDMIARLDETYKKLDDTNQHLQESNQELNTIIYKASHDLKAPLASNKGLVNLATMETKDERTLEYLKLIGKSNNRLENILHDLFQLTKIRNSQAELVRIDFNTLINDILEEVCYMDGFKNVTFNLQIDTIDNFSCDILIIRSVLQNIVENAIKYQDTTKSNSSISIKVINNNDHIQLDVEDNGIGIIQNEVGKVFNMFHRSQDHIKGTGLGLYIAKTALGGIGGKICVKSELGKGSIFTVTLPQKFTPANQKLMNPV